MSENDTLEYVVDEEREFVIDGDFNGTITHRPNHISQIMYYIELCYLPFLIVIGVSCSILVLTILIRRRLWIRHEAYIYLAAILIINNNKLIFIHGELWLSFFDRRLLKLSISVDILCKFWWWLDVLIWYVNWLHVLWLLNVYLSQQQPTTLSEGREFCANLAAKYCSLFGTKVVISSCLIACALSTFWSFSLTGVENIDESLHCLNGLNDRYFDQIVRLQIITWSSVVNMSLLAVLVLLLLIAWRRIKRSCFVFSRMNGASQDNGDAEGMTRIAVCCAVAAFFTSEPRLFMSYILYKTGLKRHFNLSILWTLFSALELIEFAGPLATPIVCFLVQSRFREDLKTIVKGCCCRCCPGSRCRRTFPAEHDNNYMYGYVLQMDQLDGDSKLMS